MGGSAAQAGVLAKENKTETKVLVIYPMRSSVPLKLGMRSRVAQCDFEGLHLYIRMPLLSA